MTDPLKDQEDIFLTGPTGPYPNPGDFERAKVYMEEFKAKHREHDAAQPGLSDDARKRLIDIDAARILHYAKQSINHALSESPPVFDDERSIERFKVVCNDILGVIGPKGKASVADVGVTHETWKSLYPNWFRRLQARVVNRLLNRGWLQVKELKWYHHFAPFTIGFETEWVGSPFALYDVPQIPDASPPGLIDHEFIEDMEKWLRSHTVSICKVSFRTPQIYIKALLNITPSLPAEAIHIDFTLSASGVQFPAPVDTVSTQPGSAAP